MSISAYSTQKLTINEWGLGSYPISQRMFDKIECADSKKQKIISI